MQKNENVKGSILYILGRFPVLSETFVQEEIMELENQKVNIQIFSLFKLQNIQETEVVWRGKAKNRCISQYGILFLLLNAIQCFLRTPLCFVRTCLIMLRHYRLNFLVGCRVLLFASFISNELEHEDIVHIHAHFASESASVAQFTYLLTGIPYSFTAHANDIYLSSKDALAFKIKMARFVITISHYNQKYLEELLDRGVSQHIYCIYNGLNLQKFSFPLPDVPLYKNRPIIIAVCRLVEKKGLMYLLYACHILADQGYDFVCHIVGDGPQRSELEQKICELNLSNKVVLLGSQTHEQVTEIYQKASIMALPCIITKNGDRDGIPTVLIESLYAGIPSISTTVSGISELIDSEINGLLVSPNDSVALAGAIVRLLNDSLLVNKLAINGYKTVQDRFDISKNVLEIVKLFYQDAEC